MIMLIALLEKMIMLIALINIKKNTLIALLQKCFVEEVIVTSFICSSVASLVCLFYRIFGGLSRNCWLKYRYAF